MKCNNCGYYINNDDKFCKNCGNTVNDESCKYGDNISDSKYDASSCHTKQYAYSYEYSNKQKPSYNMYSTHEEQYNYNKKYSVDSSKYNYINTTLNDSGDDKYIKSYIGKNYTQIKKSKFSLPAFFFGPWYLLYRKIWNYSFITIIISFAAKILLEENLSSLTDIIISIVLATKFQQIYFQEAEKQVELIKQQNLDKTTTELLNECSKKGKTSILRPIVIYILLQILIIISKIWKLKL